MLRHELLTPIDYGLMFHVDFMDALHDTFLVNAMFFLTPLRRTMLSDNPTRSPL